MKGEKKGQTTTRVTIGCAATRALGHTPRRRKDATITTQLNPKKCNPRMR
jgi:hypothetical protein